VLATRLGMDRTRIERLEATRRDFVANVSHELRTPTTALQGYAETLLRGGVDRETTARFLETLHRQAQRIGVLVTDLLVLSEAEAHVPGARAASPVSVAEVVKEAVLTVREGIPGACPVTIDVPDSLLVSGDAGAVQQIVENLVSNAVRYGGKGGSVRTSAQSLGERVRIVVEDTGPGISPQHLPRIFERFYRVDPARSRAEGGTGLGLAIVKHLTESMDGSVSVESELGRGTRFVVDLPAART
jgi:two-component system phosphate regulon sensor histidine kinase PhoR